MKVLFSFPVLALLAGCSAPRSILWDGTVAKPGKLRIQADQVVALPTASLGPYFDVLSSTADPVVELDEQRLRQLERAAVAASLDMPGMAIDMSVRVGLGAGLELGGRYVAGNKGGELRWQFLEGEPGGWNGGVGLGYMRNSYEAPGGSADVLGLEMTRQDFLIPLAFGVESGDRSGFHTNYGIGAGLAITRIEYAFTPTTEVNLDGEIRRAEVVPKAHENYASVGVHGMIQPGWNWFHLTFGASVWHTDYGTYRIPDMDPISLQGWTVLPSFGVALKF